MSDGPPPAAPGRRPPARSVARPGPPWEPCRQPVGSLAGVAATVRVRLRVAARRGRRRQRRRRRGRGAGPSAAATTPTRCSTSPASTSMPGLVDEPAAADRRRCPPSTLADAAGDRRSRCGPTAGRWSSTCGTRRARRAPGARRLRRRPRRASATEVRFVGVNPCDTVDDDDDVRRRPRRHLRAAARSRRVRSAEALDVVAYPVTLFVAADGDDPRLDRARSTPTTLRERIEELWP